MKSLSLEKTFWSLSRKKDCLEKKSQLHHSLNVKSGLLTLS